MSNWEGSATGHGGGCGAAEAEKDDIVTTCSVPTADSTIGDDVSLDTSFMDVCEIENIRKQDAFMYHSIVQQQRRMSNTMGNESNGSTESTNYAPFDEFNPRAFSNSIPRDILEILGGIDLEDVEANSDAAAQEEQQPTQTSNQTRNGEGFGATPSTSDQQQSTQGRMLRQRSRSLMSNRRTPQQRRCTQSFSGFTTGVVTRKRRVTTECHHSLVLPDPETMRSVMNSIAEDSTLMENLIGESDSDSYDEKIMALFNMSDS